MRRLCIALLLLAGLGAAKAQVNPSQINWPPSCKGNSGALYGPTDNACVIPSGGPGGGLPVNNPAYTGTLTGPNATLGPINFNSGASAQTTRGNMGIPSVSILDYQPVLDARLVTDGVMSSGSPNLSSASTPWATCPTGKTISVQSAGGTGGSNQPLLTTVLSCTDSGHIVLNASATQAVTAAGVIWGTNNLAAFQAWAAALPGKTGLIPQGNYLINMAPGTITLGSNENIEMARSATIYEVGVNLNSGGALFTIPAGTSNVTFTGMHVEGEMQNTANPSGVANGYQYGAAIYAGFSGAASSHIVINRSLFNHLLGMVFFDFNNNDFDIDISDHNSFLNIGNTALNPNIASGLRIDGNYFNCCSGAIESASPNSIYTNNTVDNDGGQYVMAFGGNTSGSPYSGVVVENNIINTSTATNGCLSVSDGVSNSLIAHNTCNYSGTAGNFNGIVNSFVNPGGSPPGTNNNQLIGNTVIINSPTGGAGAGIYVSGAPGDQLIGNRTLGVAHFGVGINASTGVISKGNFWHAAVMDISLTSSTTASMQDSILEATYENKSGSSYLPDSFLSNGSTVIYQGAPTLPGFINSQLYSAAGTPLPTCNTAARGSHYSVSDATSPTYLGTYASGGAVLTPVFCNGTNWVTY